MTETTIHSNQHQIDKVNSMLTAMDKPKVSAELQKWIDVADKLSNQFKMDMGVVEVYKGHYQVWPVSQCKSNNVYIAEYVGEENK